MPNWMSIAANFPKPAKYRAQHVFWLCLASLGVALVFLPGLTHSFSADDYPHLVKNVFFNDFFHALSVFAEFDGREYRPVVRLSLWLNYQISQTAVPFHYTNLLLHIVCSLCIFGILRSLAQTLSGAVLGTLIFALHPIHTTNVFFVMGRTDLVCAVFYLLSVLFFVKHLVHGKRVFVVVSAISFVLCLLSKEMAASLPFMLLVFAALYSHQSWPQRLIWAFRKTFVFFMLLSIYMLIRIYSWSDNTDSISGYVSYSIAGIVRNLALWATGLGYPFDLYSLRALLESKPGIVVLLAVLYGLLILAIVRLVVGKNGRTLVADRTLLVGVAWFFLTLLPVLGGLPHRWYLYIPSASMSFLVAALMQSAQRPRLLTLCILIFCLLGSAEIVRQSLIWRKQDAVSEAFFLELERKGIHEQSPFYFANMPFGYESAYLFTFHSLEDAMLLRWGKRPEIFILSHLNLTEGTSTRYSRSGDTFTVEIQPDRYSFFLFPVAQRRFSNQGQVFNVRGGTIRLDSLTPSGTVSRYSIELPRDSTPFYYFDGSFIQRIR